MDYTDFLIQIQKENSISEKDVLLFYFQNYDLINTFHELDYNKTETIKYYLIALKLLSGDKWDIIKNYINWHEVNKRELINSHSSEKELVTVFTALYENTRFFAMMWNYKTLYEYQVFQARFSLEKHIKITPNTVFGIENPLSVAAAASDGNISNWKQSGIENELKTTEGITFAILSFQILKQDEQNFKTRFHLEFNIPVKRYKCTVKIKVLSTGKTELYKFSSIPEIETQDGNSIIYADSASKTINYSKGIKILNVSIKNKLL